MEWLYLIWSTKENQGQGLDEGHFNVIQCVKVSSMRQRNWCRRLA